MSGTTRAEVRTLKVGRYIAIDEKAYKILSISTSKPGKHGGAKARIDLVDIFTGQKKSHVAPVTDSITVPLLEKGSAIVTHIEGQEVHAMDTKSNEMMILPMPGQDEGMTINPGGEIQWMEALDRFSITRDH